MQAVLQGQWPDDPSIKGLPHMDSAAVKALRGRRGHLCDLIELVNSDRNKLKRDLEKVMSAGAAEDCMHVLARLPAAEMRCSKPQLRAAPADEAGPDAADDGEELEQYSIQLTLKRKGLASIRQKGSKAGGQRARVFAPRCAPSGYVKILWWLL